MAYLANYTFCLYDWEFYEYEKSVLPDPGEFVFNPEPVSIKKTSNKWEVSWEEGTVVTVDWVCKNKWIKSSEFYYTEKMLPVYDSDRGNSTKVTFPYTFTAKYYFLLDFKTFYAVHRSYALNYTTKFTDNNYKADLTEASAKRTGWDSRNPRNPFNEVDYDYPLLSGSITYGSTLEPNYETYSNYYALNYRYRIISSKDNFGNDLTTTRTIEGTENELTVKASIDRFSITPEWMSEHFETPYEGMPYEVTHTVVENPYIEFNVNPFKGGSVNRSSDYYCYDYMVAVTAYRAKRYKFLNWTDSEGNIIVDSEGNPVGETLYFTPRENTNYTANFEEVVPIGTYWKREYSDVIYIIGTPEPGYTEYTGSGEMLPEEFRQEIHYVYFSEPAIAPVDISNMFAGCYFLREIHDIDNFDTTNTTNMSGLFANCSYLDNFDCSRLKLNVVTDVSRMFENCYELSELSLGNFNTTNISNYTNMFSNCYQLNYIYVGKDWSVNSGSATTNMFTGCTELHNFNGTTDGTYAIIDDGTNNGYLNEDITAFDKVFYKTSEGWKEVEALMKSSVGWLSVECQFKKHNRWIVEDNS